METTDQGHQLRRSEHTWKIPEYIPDEDLTRMPLALLLVLASVLQTSATYSEETRPKLANQDIAALVAHGLPERVILQAINATENEFDVSRDGLPILRKPVSVTT
jgi:hypothetical protein